ncbi:hypothetical protein HAX54_035398, partial [Datura stramonium]|nr:hypothetical protein [Datura stramonium]
MFLRKVSRKNKKRKRIDGEFPPSERKLKKSKGGISSKKVVVVDEPSIDREKEASPPKKLVSCNRGKQLRGNAEK